MKSFLPVYGRVELFFGETGIDFVASPRICIFFFGKLATAFPRTAFVDGSVSVLQWKWDVHRPSLMNLSLDGILLCMQNETLKKVKHWLQPRTMRLSSFGTMQVSKAPVILNMEHLRTPSTDLFVVVWAWKYETFPCWTRPGQYEQERVRLLHVKWILSPKQPIMGTQRNCTRLKLHDSRY